MKKTKKMLKFEELSKDQQRVEIAKDVLLQIKKEFITPNSGSYLHFLKAEDHSSCDKFQEIISKKVQKCQACAVGAMFVCAVKNYNSCELTGSPWDSTWYDREMRNHLKKYFTLNQLHLIELYFEGEDVGGWFSKNKTQEELSDIFHKNMLSIFGNEEGYLSRSAWDNFYRTVMQEIMKNIIANNGTFKPTKQWVNSFGRKNETARV